MLFKPGYLICTVLLHPAVIAKVFRQADTEESGMVDPGLVPALAIKVLGNDVKESEKQMIVYKAEMKAAAGKLGEEGLIPSPPKKRIRFF